ERWNVRTFVIHCATIGVLVGSVPNIVWAGSVGRRNTAIAATALAAGAWANGTGHTGRRNTAILATGGAVYAWSRYNKSKHGEKRRPAACAWDGHRDRGDRDCEPERGHGKCKKG